MDVVGGGTEPPRADAGQEDLWGVGERRHDALEVEVDVAVADERLCPGDVLHRPCGEVAPVDVPRAVRDVDEVPVGDRVRGVRAVEDAVARERTPASVAGKRPAKSVAAKLDAFSAHERMLKQAPPPSR